MACPASSAGSSNRSPDSLIFCLARLIRCAMVASGTRNAPAISAVVRPPTARSVSATADAGVSAGWQHSDSSTSVSSWPLAGAGAGSCAAPASSRRRRAVSLRYWSVSARAAAWISQPRGLPGIPSSGQCVAAASRASWTASSAAPKSPYRRASTPRTCGASSRSRSSAGVVRPVTRPGYPGPGGPRWPAGSARRRDRARPTPGPRSRSPWPRTRRRSSGSRPAAPSTRGTARR